MRFFELIPLVGSICNLFVTVFVLTRGLRSTIRRVFLLWGTSIAFWNFSLTLGLTVASVFILSYKRRQLPPLQKARLTALIIAQSALVVFGINDVLPILGLDKYPLINVPVYPLGSMAAIFYGLIVG